MTTSARERVCRFRSKRPDAPARVGAVVGEEVVDLSAAGVVSLAADDRITITIDGIGTPENDVVVV